MEAEQAAENLNGRLDAVSVEKHARLLHGIRYVRTLLVSSDPYLITQGMLDQMNKPASDVLSAIRSPAKGQEAGALTNANAYLDRVLEFSRLIPPLTTGDGAKQLVEVTRDFVSYADRASAASQARSDELDKNIQNLSMLIAAETQKATEMSKIIETQKGRLDAAISEFQKQFSQAEERRRADFADRLKKHEDEHQILKTKTVGDAAAFLKARMQEAETFKKTASDNAQAILNTLEEKKKEASNLVHVIANIGVTGNFSGSATQERKAANILRAIAIFFMTGIVVGAAATIVVAALRDPDWKLTVLRLFATFTMAIPAFYAARESELHRRNEQRYRRLELELASIDPFLENLPPDKRHALKTQLADRFFAQPELQLDKHEPVSAKSMFEVITNILLNLTKT